MPDQLIVCTLQPGDLNARTAQLLPGVAAIAVNTASIDNGFRFEFAVRTTRSPCWST